MSMIEEDRSNEVDEAMGGQSMGEVVAPIDFLRLKKTEVNYDMNVETDLLENVTFREATTTGTGFCRFDLQKKGMLHSQSKLFLSLLSTGVAADSNATYPLNIGVGSLIDRAVLKCGNQVLNEISDWQFLHMIKSSLISNETKVERELYTSGRCVAKDYDYRQGVGRTQNNHIDAIGQMLDNGCDYNTDAAPADDLLPPVFARLGDADPDVSPTYSIDLSDLFPFLKTYNLPLYLIDEPLSIELHWSPTLANRLFVGTAVGSGATAQNLNINELKFAADYIFYSADEMQRYADEVNSKGLGFQFPDYRLSKFNASAAELQAGVVRNLGMANRFVSRVLSVASLDYSQQNDKITQSQDRVFGRYNAAAPAQGADEEVGGFKYNIRYNDRFEFPTDISNYARAFTHFTQSESLPFVGRREYSNQGGVSISQTAKMIGASQDVSLNGTSLLLGTRLSNGRVGTRGIELHLTLGETTALVSPGGSSYVVRSYSEYMRSARLQNGRFDIFNV